MSRPPYLMRPRLAAEPAHDCAAARHDGAAEAAGGAHPDGRDAPPRRVRHRRGPRAAAISGPPASSWLGAAANGNGTAAWRESLPAMAASASSNGSGNGADAHFEPQYRDNGAAAAPVGGNGRGSARRRPPLWRRLFPPVLTRIGAQPANAAELGTSNGTGGGYDVRQNGSGNGAASFGSGQLNGVTLYPRQSGGNGASPPGLNGSAPSLNGASARATATLNGARPGSSAAQQVGTML